MKAQRLQLKCWSRCENVNGTLSEAYPNLTATKHSMLTGKATALKKQLLQRVYLFLGEASTLGNGGNIKSFGLHGAGSLRFTLRSSFGFPLLLGKIDFCPAVDFCSHIRFVVSELIQV